MALPCEPWTTVDRMCCPDQPDGVDCNGAPVVAGYKWSDAELIDVASRLLYHATCERFTGACTGQSLRPCSCTCSDYSCCKCRVSFVPLAGRYPVLQIDEVKIDGVTLLASSYRLDEYARLVRVDGLRWPHWQNLAGDPDVDVDTFVVRYTVGRLVPDDLQYAAALLACELKKACGGQGCALPDNVTRLVRDGMEMELVDPAEFQSRRKGAFGVPDIDRIVEQYLPCGKRGPKQRLMFADDVSGLLGG